MKEILLKSIIALTISTYLTSCGNAYVSEDETNEAKATGLLNIRTRANASEDATVSYPVQIYVFNSAGKCRALSTISSADDVASFSLASGTYTVNAIGGADADSYELPTKENATSNTAISLKEGKGHGDMMTASNTITLGEEESNTLSLAFVRKVMQVKSVTILNAPQTSTAVKITMAPLHETLTIGNGYTDATCSRVISLVKQSDGTTWKSAAAEYMLPAIDGATVTVSITYVRGTKSFSYTCGDKLEAGYKINLTGTYTATDEVALTGTLIGVEWKGEHDIIFDFAGSGENNGGSTGGETGDSTEGETGGETGASTAEAETVSSIPAFGSMYKGCFVLAVNDATATGATLTLLSPKETTGLVYDSSSNEEVEAAITAALPKCSVDGISGWRVPYKAEAQLILANATAIRLAMNEAAATTLPSTGNYYYRMTSGEINAFKIGSSSFAVVTIANTDILRPVTTVAVKLE